MEDKKIVDVNDNKTDQGKLEGPESSNEVLMRYELPKDSPRNVELLKKLAERKERISKLEQYAETAEKLGQNLEKFVGDFVAGLQIPIDLQKAKSTATTALPSASATVSPSSVADKRPTPVDVGQTQTQTLPNADVEVLEHDNSKGESSSITQHAAIADSNYSPVERIAQSLVKNWTIEDVHRLVERLNELVGQKEANSDAPKESIGSITMTVSSSANDPNNDATTSYAHVDDQVASDTDSTSAENHSQNDSNGNDGFDMMDLPVIPSASPTWTPKSPETPQGATSNESSSSSSETSQQPNLNASNAYQQVRLNQTVQMATTVNLLPEVTFELH